MRKYLKKIREKKRLTQLELANKLNISESYYSMIENGERKKVLDLNLISKISEVFNVSIEWIAEQEQKEQRWWNAEARRNNKKRLLCIHFEQ